MCQWRELRQEEDETYQLREKVTDPTIGYISCQSIEGKRPRHGVHQRLLELIHFEMLVSDALLVRPHSRNRQHSVFRREPSSIQLVVWNDIPEDEAQESSEASVDEKDNLPGRQCCATRLNAAVDAVGYEAAEDLSETIMRSDDNDVSGVMDKQAVNKEFPAQERLTR